jgi:5-methylcytosine-specific restriction endonuclease McrA
MHNRTQKKEKQMSQPQNLTRLIRRIARQTTNPNDISQALAHLQQYPHWERDIAHERQNQLSRESRRVQQANRRAQEKGLPGILMLGEWLGTLDYFQWRCAYCQLPFSYDDLEHFQPLTQDPEGYGTAVYNCVPACRTCNLRKGTKLFEHWLSQSRQLQLPLVGIPHDPLAEDILRVAQILRGWQESHGRVRPLSPKGEPWFTPDSKQEKA